MIAFLGGLALAIWATVIIVTVADHGPAYVKWGICDHRKGVGVVQNLGRPSDTNSSIVTCNDGTRYRISARRLP